MSTGHKVLLRPHHLMCSLAFQGKGYSSAFVENMWSVVNALRQSDATEIEIVPGLDNICQPCPHNLGHKCQSQSEIEFLDLQHMKALTLSFGERLTWGDAKNRIKKQMSVEKFTSVCSTCSWQKSGICEKALRDLLNEEKES